MNYCLQANRTNASRTKAKCTNASRLNAGRTNGSRTNASRLAPLAAMHHDAPLDSGRTQQGRKAIVRRRLADSGQHLRACQSRRPQVDP